MGRVNRERQGEEERVLGFFCLFVSEKAFLVYLCLLWFYLVLLILQAELPVSISKLSDLYTTCWESL